MKTRKVQLFVDEAGEYYVDACVVHKDVDTPGAQFVGWATKKSVEASSCVDRWVRVKPVVARVTLPVQPPEQIAVVEIRFRGEWAPIIDVMHPSQTPFTTFDVSEAVSQIRVRYKHVV